jgi:hypothetical protein
MRGHGALDGRVSLPTETRGIITVLDIERRLRQLECQRRGCSCHACARARKGTTHCPLHPLRPEATLSLEVLVDWTMTAECSAGCDQMRLWRALFGDVIVAWAAARWEGIVEQSRPRQRPKPTFSGIAVP